MLPNRAPRTPGHAASLITAVALGVGVAMFQVTSLVLAPQVYREFRFSFALPEPPMALMVVPTEAHPTLVLGTQQAEPSLQPPALQTAAHSTVTTWRMTPTASSSPSLAPAGRSPLPTSSLVLVTNSQVALEASHGDD